MKPLEQTRIGKIGNCFATCLASILETGIPEFGVTDDPGYWDHVDNWLRARGLQYSQVPIEGNPAPVGWHTIEGVSPRGGMHAVVGYNGQFVHDPHPRWDDPRRGLVKPMYYGLLTPVKARANDVSRGMRPRRTLLRQQGLVKLLKLVRPDGGGEVYAVEYPHKVGNEDTDKQVMAQFMQLGEAEHLYKRMCDYYTGKTTDAIAPIEYVKRLFSDPYKVEWTPEKLATVREIVGNLRETIKLIESESPLTPARRAEAEKYKRQAMEWQEILRRNWALDVMGLPDRKVGKLGTKKANQFFATMNKDWECPKCGAYTAVQLMRCRKCGEPQPTQVGDRADMMRLRRNTQRQGGPFHIQVTEPSGRESTMPVREAVDAVSNEFKRTAKIHKEADERLGRKWSCTCAPCIQVREGMPKSEWLRRISAKDAVAPIPPFKLGDKIRLANKKTTAVRSIKLAENLFGEPEWHVLTTSGDAVTIKFNSKEKQ